MPKQKIKIAIVTPTYQRDFFLAQTLSYIEQQQQACFELRWFVLDDSVQISNHVTYFQDKKFVEYKWLEEKLPLGEKRNLLNQMAKNWGAEMICSMDDDDWYGPTYISEMYDLLFSQSDLLFSGSAEDYYYDLAHDRILRIPAFYPNSSCNGVLCYKVTALDQHHYQSTAQFAEESHFLNHAKVLQLPDIKRVHLALAHPNNTVSKKNFCSEQYTTQLSLDDLPMLEKDKAFYRQLHLDFNNQQ